MVDTTINFGTSNTERYYTMPKFSLPNGDWCIGFWERFIETPPTGTRRSAVSLHDTAEPGSINIQTAQVNEGPYETLAILFDDSGNGSFYSGTQNGSYVEGGDYLTIVQRRGANLEFYRVLFDTVAASPSNSETHPFTAGFSGGASTLCYLGVRNDLTRYRIDPFGEFFVLSGSSLSAAEVTTLAAGAHITAVRPTPYVDLRLREANATEPDLGSANLDATRVGSGWTTAAEFFPDGEEEEVIRTPETGMSGGFVDMTGGMQ
jgi:hypothetical protein